MKKVTLSVFFFLGILMSLSANNIRITTIPVVSQDTSDNPKAQIKFSIAWDNSWRSSSPANYDAAWIFVKCWDGDFWQHVYLDTAPALNSPGKGTNIDVESGDSAAITMKLEFGYSMAKKLWGRNTSEVATRQCAGVFLHRASLGSGHIKVKDVTLGWDFTAQGFSPDDDLVVKIFALEMVYVPKVF